MDMLNPLDAAFVDAEDQDKQSSFAIASVAVFEGPAPSYEEFLSAVAQRLALVPLHRRKLRKVPFGLGPPVWVDAQDFDIRYHIRQTALPAPGGDEQLSRLVGRVMSQRLDRRYPLWEYWLVEGLRAGRWALVCKVHHCMVDGVSGMELYQAIFDLTPEPSLPAADYPAVPPEPSGTLLAARAAVDALVLPLRNALALSRMLAHPQATARHAEDILQGTARLMGALWPAPGSSLTGSIGRQRRYAWSRASLDEVREIKRELGGTVNDVILAAISGGFRQLLLARGETPTSAMVPSLVPVSVRAAGEENIFDNRVSAIVADLPVHIADPAERLAAVIRQMSGLKASREADAGQAVTSLGGHTWFPFASLLVRALFSLPQREIVTVTTNVPGPSFPLYTLGRRLVEIIPYVPIATTIRTGISVLSYCGSVTFGVTGDYDSTPDIDVLVRGIEDSLTELLKVAGERRPAGPVLPAASERGRPPAGPAQPAGLLRTDRGDGLAGRQLTGHRAVPGGVVVGHATVGLEYVVAAGGRGSGQPDRGHPGAQGARCRPVPGGAEVVHTTVGREDQVAAPGAGGDPGQGLAW
jgi:WS/DGAT/MGAT family acyltransferase